MSAPQLQNSKYRASSSTSAHTSKTIVSSSGSTNIVQQTIEKSNNPIQSILVKYRLKIVVVGDGAIGKTCLLANYSTGQFLDCYIPTVFENVIVRAEMDDNLVELALWDTAGQDDYARPLSYPGTDVFMVCFAIDRPESYNNVTDKWLKEIKHYCGDTPVILIGLKSDLRDNQETAKYCIPYDQPLKLRDKGLVEDYYECSSITGKNIGRAVEIAALLSIKYKERRRISKKRCNIL